LEDNPAVKKSFFFLPQKGRRQIYTIDHLKVVNSYLSVRKKEEINEKMNNIRKKFNGAVEKIPVIGEFLAAEVLVKELAIAAAIAALTALIPLPANASGSVEAMAGEKTTTIDTKVSTEVAPDTNLFLRQMTTSDYNSKVSFFGLADLTYNIFGGLDAVAEVQAAPGMGVIPRLGAQYFGQFGDFSVYALGTVKAMEHPDGEFIVNMGYTPELTEGVRLLTNVENLTSIGEEGHQFSVQRLRAGLKFMDKYGIGFGADLTEVGNDGELNYNMGGFASLGF